MIDRRDIIHYNTKLGELSINKEVILAVFELRRLYELRKDKPFQGTITTEEIDVFFEFKMLWWMFHPASPAFRKSATDEERLQEAVAEHAPNGWKMHIKFRKAMDYYKELMETYNPIYSLLSNQTKAVNTISLSIEKMTKALSVFIANADLDITDPDSVGSFESAQKILGELLDNGKNLNKIIASFREIEGSFSEEEDSILELRGGMEWSPSLDPDNAIEKF